MRILVVGGTAAGPAAAVQAKRTRPEAEVVLVERGPAVSVGTCEVPALVDGRIERPEGLVVVPPGALRATRGVETWLGTEAVAVEPAYRRLHVRDLATGAARAERYDALVLATGARARRLGLDGEDAPNVAHVRHYADAARLHGLVEGLPAGAHAVVVGAGYVGLELAEAFVRRGLRATVLDPTGDPLPGYLDADLRGPVAAAAAAHGVRVRAERPTGFDVGPDGHVRAVRTDAGELVGCAFVVVAIGVEPETALGAAAGVRVGRSGAFVVDDGMRTNVAGVWACGDAVEVRRVVDGARVWVPLAPIANRTAHVAGTNAARRGAGAPARYPGATPSSAVKVFGVEVARVGLSEAEARAAGFDAATATVTHRSRGSHAPEAAPLTVRLVAERRRGRLLGAQLVGADGAALRADVLVPLVRAGATADALADADFVYAPPVAPATDALTKAARALLKALARPAPAPSRTTTSGGGRPPLGGR